MAEYNTEVDVGNRALQLCGAARIDPTLGFNEDSKNASEVAFAYGKCRRAELMCNAWGFAIKTVVLRAVDTDTMTLTPSLWVQTTTYFVGCIVSDETGTLWQSRIPENLGNQPQNSLTWEPYFGALTASLYDSTIAYFAGEVVYTAVGDGTFRAYISLESANADVPATATAWSSIVTYQKDDVVTYLGTAYLSLIDLNLFQVPTSVPAPWNSATTYGSGITVSGSDNIIYSSLGGGNTNNDPVTTGGAFWLAIAAVPWTSSFVAGHGSIKWRQIGGVEFPVGVGLAQLNNIYRTGSGPSWQSGTRNLFRLPAAHLRPAPPIPNSGRVTSLGGPNFICDNDWTRQGNYLISGLDTVILYRFVADVTDVTQMNDLFCEALAAAIGKAVCDAITQSQSQLAGIAQAYRMAISAARIQNGIEQGVQEPPDDELIACRY